MTIFLEDKMECQEPKCTREATKDWNGRKVCDDHYDFYREEFEKIKSDMFQ